MGSEDFAHYTREKPGAFFFLGSGRVMKDIMIHDSRFDANDDLVDIGSNFWLKIAEDRLNLI